MKQSLSFDGGLVVDSFHDVVVLCGVAGPDGVAGRDDVASLGG